MFRRNSKSLSQRLRRHFRPNPDGLENREVYAVSVSVSSTGTLTANISGTDPAQSFDLRASGSTRKLVFWDGLSWKDVLRNGSTVSAGFLNRIQVNGSDMANQIKLSYVKSGAGFSSALEDPVNPRIIVNCMGGNDTVGGSYFSDRIDGGSGNDKVDAFDGNDVLIAGTGRDTLGGGNGDDFIIAMNPDSGSLFNGIGHNRGDRYRGKRPGNWSVSNFEFFEYV